MDIGVGLSLDKDPSRAAKEAIIAAKSNIHKTKIDLAIVFTSLDIPLQGFLKTSSLSLSGVPVIGSSGTAIISHQGTFKHGAVVMLISLPDGAYCNVAYTKEIQNRSGTEAGEELGEKLLVGFQNVRRCLGIILSDALIQQSSGLISGLQEKLGRSFPLVGASISDNVTFSKTRLFFNQDVFNDGCIGILCGGKLQFGLGVKHGWKPIGKPHTVTSAERNIVETIDGQPAAKLYEDYLGCTLSSLKKELTHISLLYPIGINVPGEKEFLLRNIISVDDSGFLRFQGTVPEGSVMRLMISTKEACFAAAKEAAEEANKSLITPFYNENKKGEFKKFVLVFSSISRYNLLKRERNNELEIIKQAFEPNTPIIGLYTYGELAPLMAINYRGEVYFHNQTVSILTIGG